MESPLAGTSPTIGFVISLILIAFGAILTWAVHSTSSSIDVNTVGVILMIVGIIVFVLSIVLWRTWWGSGFWGGWYDEGRPGRPAALLQAVHQARTEYVEEEPPPRAIP